MTQAIGTIPTTDELQYLSLRSEHERTVEAFRTAMATISYGTFAESPWRQA